MAVDQVVSVTEEGIRLIVLDASDAETDRADLTFNLESGPAHGTLDLGANGAWTYTPDADYAGNDSFTFSVSDRGDPDGSSGNALSSNIATVLIGVNNLNDAPFADPIDGQTLDEGGLLNLVLTAYDPDGDVLTWSLVSGPASASLDPASGEFSWFAADGDADHAVTARVTDGSGLFDEVSFNIHVANVVPTLVLNGPLSVEIGRASCRERV